MAEEDSTRPHHDPSVDAELAAINEAETPGVGRLLALSDGVVAIALTLLVLQLTVPALPVIQGTNNRATSPSWLYHALTKNGEDQFTAYVISFYVIGQFWLTHHREFRNISGHDEGLAWWNFFFLFTITLMPFTSELIGRFGQNPLAITVFSINLLLASLSTVGLRVFARRKGLLRQIPEPMEIQVSRFRTLGVFMVIGLAITLAWLRPDLASFSWLLLIGVQRWAEWMAKQFPPRALRPNSV